MISGESITKVCDAIDGLTDKEFKREFDRFLDTQSVQTIPNAQRRARRFKGK